MATRISVFNSKELQGILVAMKAVEPEVSKQIRRVTKQVIEPVWKSAVTSRVRDAFQSKVLGATARVAVSNQNVTLQSARIGRSLSGGIKPSDAMHSAEFGADQSKTSTYTATSSRGKKYQVTRRTRTQFLPRKKGGYVVYPAVAEVIPRIASLWVQTTVRTFYELIEKK